MTAEDWYDFDYFDDGQLSCWEVHRETSSTTWMLKDKSVVNIKDMETSHIRNSLSMLEKMDNDECKAYLGLVKELNRRFKHDTQRLNKEATRTGKLLRC